MATWLGLLEEKFDVFFSSPLDIDFAMLEAFPDKYKGQVDGQAKRGPRMPKPDSQEYPAALLDRVKQVLAANPSTAPGTTGSTYTPAQWELFPWYKYLFVDGSKPVAHMAK